jgi:hypothetical protein
MAFSVEGMRDVLFMKRLNDTFCVFLSNNTKNENLFLKRNFLFIDIKGNPFTFDIKDKKKLTVQYVGQLRRLSFPLA